MSVCRLSTTTEGAMEEEEVEDEYPKLSKNAENFCCIFGDRRMWTGKPGGNIKASMNQISYNYVVM